MTTLQAVYDAQREAEEYNTQLANEIKPNAGQTAQAHALTETRDRLQAEVGGPVFLIPDQNLPVLDVKLTKLNKAAVKLDCPQITISTEPAEPLTIKHGENKGEVIERTYVVVKGSAPKLNGWSFVATLEHDYDENTGENDVILRRIPTFEGEANLSAYVHASPENCDHCHTKRRRNDTYVVQHEDGTMKQVGSNCLRDFLGHANPQWYARFCESIASLMEEFGDAEEYEFSGPSYERRIDTEFFLSHVACMIRNYGWTSRTKARNEGGSATADDADNNMFNESRKKTDRQGVPLWITPSDEDVATAQKAIAWVRDLTEEQIQPTERSDYLYNLYTVVKKDSIKMRQSGIAASAISAMNREEERKIQREADAKGRLDEFLGEIKERRIFKFKVEQCFAYESDYYGGGAYYKHVMRDESGATLVWNGSYELERGLTYEGKFTIKKHVEHDRYGKQTYITRPHKLEEVEA